jgi:DNA-binding NtrC family response regulator
MGLQSILVVDDEEDIAMQLLKTLENMGFDVDAFTNSEEALEHFKSREKKYSLVISDIRMPGMSGIQLANRIKSIDPDIKILLLTAFEINMSEFDKVMHSTKVDGFMQKPVSIERLTSEVSKCLKKPINDG